MTGASLLGFVAVVVLIVGIGSTLASWWCGGYGERNDAKRRNHR